MPSIVETNESRLSLSSQSTSKSFSALEYYRSLSPTQFLPAGSEPEPFKPTLSRALVASALPWLPTSSTIPPIPPKSVLPPPGRVLMGVGVYRVALRASLNRRLYTYI